MPYSSHMEMKGTPVNSRLPSGPHSRGGAQPQHPFVDKDPSGALGCSIGDQAGSNIACATVDDHDGPVGLAVDAPKEHAVHKHAVVEPPIALHHSSSVQAGTPTVAHTTSHVSKHFVGGVRRSVAARPTDHLHEPVPPHVTGPVV